MNDLRNDPEEPAASGTWHIVGGGEVSPYTSLSQAADDRDLRTVDQRIDERLKAIEAALSAQANVLQVLLLERETRGPRP